MSDAYRLGNGDPGTATWRSKPAPNTDSTLPRPRRSP